MPTAGDLLLHLRCRAPHLARRLDGIRSLGYRDGTLTVKVPEDSWCTDELRHHAEALRGAAAQLFDRPVGIELVVLPPTPDALPLPVASTKYWNHVAFVAATEHAVGVVAVPKPLYLDCWLTEYAADSAQEAVAVGSEGKGVRILRYPAGLQGPSPEAALTSIFPELLDELAELGRLERSYVQLVMEFPGDPAADSLESRLYAVREWGTPRTPKSVLHKYVGRLHYLGARAPALGLRLAKRIAAG